MLTTDCANECIQGQGHFLALAQCHLHLKIKTCFSQKLLGYLNQILCVSFYVQGNVNLLHDVGHMTKLSIMCLFVENPLKSSLEPVGSFQ